MRLLRSVLREAASLAGLDEEGSNAVVLAANEACMNIIQHAYAMDPNGRIDVTVLREEGALVLLLRDYAGPVDPDTLCSRDLDEIRPGGLGMHLIDCLVDERCFLEVPEGGGNLLRLKKLLHE
ncbi:MAG TPA: ATP-binding protein [Gammaproteobacteria bacterium]|nr:ATP-binding protein [Gammaproteobacteria bacterium]